MSGPVLAVAVTEVKHVDVQSATAGEEINFDKTDTLNQRTPYDYGSVMHYDRSV